jgi:putative tryptophan/tyrosine transport system substrate-binding protein
LERSRHDLDPALGLRKFLLAEPMISRRAIIGAGVMFGLAAVTRAQVVAPPAGDRMRRLGVLMGLSQRDPEAGLRTAALEQGLRELGWEVGRNLQIDYRWAAGIPEQTSSLAKELIGLQPEIVLANSRPVLAALRQETGTIPIIFTLVSDPLGGGFVESLAHPGGNITGFAGFSFPIAGKWLDTLREIVPRVPRVALMGSSKTAPYDGYWRVFEAAARRLAIEPISSQISDPARIEPLMIALGQRPGGGLIVLPDNFTLMNRDLIVGLAERYRVPAIYPYRHYVVSGGLVSDGIDAQDVFRRAGSYVDRIFKGAKPGDLQVQQPAKFELVVNIRTAETLGLTMPQSLLAIANEKIE